MDYSDEIAAQKSSEVDALDEEESDKALVAPIPPQPFLGSGLWNDPGNLEGLSSGLSHLHVNAHGHKREYREKCDDCEAAYRNGTMNGCQLHLSDARNVVSGDVTKSSLFKDTKAWISLPENNNHVRQGSCQLLPEEIHDIGDHAINSNRPFLFGLYVMLLLAIELFLRKCEFASLTELSFNTSLFVMFAENVPRALNIKVQGKKKHNKCGKNRKFVFLHSVVRCYAESCY